MTDFCPTCRKRRERRTKRDRQGNPMFTRVPRAGEAGFCAHKLPQRINVVFQPKLGGAL